MWSFATAAIKLIYTKDAKQNKIKQNKNKQRSHHIQKKHFHFYMAAAVFAHCFWSPSSFCWARLCCLCFLSIASIELHKCYGFFVFFFGNKFTGHWFKVFSLYFVYIHLKDVAWSTVSNEKKTHEQMKYRSFLCVSKCKWSIIIFCYCSVYLFVAMIKLSREFHYWVISFGRLFMQTPTLSEAS